MKKKKNYRRIIRDRASEQMASYFEELDKVRDDDIELANSYLNICRNISKRCKVRIPRDRKILICKGCKQLIIPGKNARVRVRHNKRTHVVITCLNCKRQKRYYIEKNKQGKD